MNAERLIELYERVADAPDAVSRLRRFILDLAIRGKLTDQDSSDETARELLKRIEAAKTELVATGKIKKSKVVPALESEQTPFVLPANWTWTQIAKLGVVSPRNDAVEDQSASFVPMTLIASEYGTPHQHEQRLWRDLKKGYTHFAEGDVGLAKITPCFENGKSTVFRNLVSGIGAGTTELHILRPILVSADYVLLVLKSPHFIDTGIGRMTGTAGQKRVPKEYFAHSPFPLPPLAEQHRIVAKVDELMALCDQLQATHNTRETTRDQLTTATLARLTAPETSNADFQQSALTAISGLSHITARSVQIDSLRQSILDLAAQGELLGIKQGETASVGKFRKLQNGYAFKSRWFTTRGIRLLRNANVGHGKLSWAETKHLSKERAEEFDRFQLSEGDIVLSLDRPFISTGIKVAKVVHADLPALLLQRVGRFVQVRDGLLDEFLYLWLRSPVFYRQVVPGRSNGVPHVSSKQVESAEIFVPSIAEQHRIVAKVDELMALCDRLEACLQQADDKRARLLESLLAEALAPAADEQTAA